MSRLILDELDELSGMLVLNQHGEKIGFVTEYTVDINNHPKVIFSTGGTTFMMNGQKTIDITVKMTLSHLPESKIIKVLEESTTYRKLKI